MHYSTKISSICTLHHLDLPASIRLGGEEVEVEGQGEDQTEKVVLDPLNQGFLKERGGGSRFQRRILIGRELTGSKKHIPIQSKKNLD